MAKLAWTLAAIEAHTAGALDLTAPVPHSELTPSRHRDIANILETSARTPYVTLLALGLSTSSNPIFDHLARNSDVQETAKEITGVTLTSGFSDEDLHHLVRTNLITSRTAVQLLHAIIQQAVGPLEPISLGLINSMRTSRLVRDIDTIEGLPDNLVVANKTGTLNGVRNDAALMSSGTSCLGVCALSQGNRNGHAVDNDMAQLGRALTQARFA